MKEKLKLLKGEEEWAGAQEEAPARNMRTEGWFMHLSLLFSPSGPVTHGVGTRGRMLLPCLSKQPASVAGRNCRVERKEGDHRFVL